MWCVNIFRKIRVSCLSLVGFIVVSLLLIAFYRYKFSISYTIIPAGEISSSLVPARPKLNGEEGLCELVPIIFTETWFLMYRNISDESLVEMARRTGIEPGGTWTPRNCVPQHDTVIVVPYRDRDDELKTFLAYIHPFLQYQKIRYRIFLVEQTRAREFNRGKLLNVGFTEAEKLCPASCYVFHDVDLIPLDVRNVYGCTAAPRHMSANINVYNYRLPYESLFGGAVAILKDRFKSVNGFSNMFFGWGGEDDDFYERVTKDGEPVCRFEPEVSRYFMLPHRKAEPGKDRQYYLKTGKYRYGTDGLNSLSYVLQETELHPLFTRLLVDL